MKLKTGTWVVVADGGRGLVFVNVGTAQAPELVVHRVFELDNPRTHEQGRGRPPRIFKAGGDRRAAHEQADLHQVAEDRFIREISGYLGQEALADAFRQIVVVAPPQALGAFRKAAGDALARRVMAWIDRDLTKMPVPELTAAVVRALDG